MINRWYDLGKNLIPKALRIYIRDRILASTTRAPNVWWSLQNLRRLGFCPTQIIDCGAYEGDWTRRCKEIYPEARVLCIEPQQAKESFLQQVRNDVPSMNYVMALVGKERKENVPLFVNETATTLHSYSVDGQPNAVSLMTTLDTLVESGIATPPQFVKLDVQGHELDVLEGLKKHWGSVQLIQCEMSLLDLQPDIPLFHDMIAYLRQRGMIAYDITEVIRRPFDDACWQLDFLFCRADAPWRQYKRWN
jgi:FkbM family methyltransferase